MMDAGSHRRWQWLAVIACCSLVLGFLGGLLVLPAAREQLFGAAGGRGPEQAAIGGPFDLIDHRGRPVSDRDFAGRPMVVVFGTTQDPDQTPATLQLLGRALDRIGPGADHLVVLFITLEPSHDPPSILAEFVTKFHHKLHGLTGSPNKIAAIANLYKLPLVRGPSATAAPGQLLHFDSLIFFMNSQGVYLSHLDFGSSEDELVHRLRELL